MKLFIALVSAALAQVDYEAFDLTEEEVFGSGDSDLAQLADEYDSNDLIGFGRSSGFGQDVGSVIGSRSLPPGVNIQDFLVNGVFQMNDFREALMAAYQAAAAAEETEEERYFFTTSPTTTSTTSTTTTTLGDGVKCWKCDAMTYATCASGGSWQTCPLGDKDCCFVEIRETKQKLQQLCTGCKDKTACEDNRAENFKDPSAVNYLLDQCKPDYRQQKIGRRGPQQSVCRQCFRTCNPTGTGNGSGSDYCFGGIVNAASTANVGFDLNTHQTKYPWNGHLSTLDNEFLGFGIPTGAMMDQTKDATIIGKVAGATHLTDSEVLNVFFANAADGKLITGVGTDNNVRETGEMTYWSIQGADRAWWTANLKNIQETLRGITVAGTAFATSNFV